MHSNVSSVRTLWSVAVRRDVTGQAPAHSRGSGGETGQTFSDRYAFL
jgi:hypothetical protein